MHHQHARNGCVKHRVILPFACSFHAAQAGAGAACAGVPRLGIIIVQFARRPAAREASLIEAIDIFFVHLRVNPHLPLGVLIKAPADIIMAAQIIDKPAVLRQAIENIELALKQPHIPCSQRTPEVEHHRRIVQHMALRLFLCTEVGRQLLRRHDHFTL